MRLVEARPPRDRRETVVARKDQPREELACVDGRRPPGQIRCKARHEQVADVQRLHPVERLLRRRVGGVHVHVDHGWARRRLTTGGHGEENDSGGIRNTRIIYDSPSPGIGL